jgi:hypothetical protein
VIGKRSASIRGGASKGTVAGEAVGLKQRIEMLEQETQQFSDTNKIVKRDLSEVSECCPKVRKDFTNLEHKLGELKEESRTIRPKAEPFVLPGADPVISLTPRSLVSAIPAPAARKPPSSSSNSISPSSISPPALKCSSPEAGTGTNE